METTAEHEHGFVAEVFEGRLDSGIWSVRKAAEFDSKAGQVDSTALDNFNDRHTTCQVDVSHRSHSEERLIP